MKVNTFCEKPYKVKAKGIFAALVQKEQKVKKRTLGEGLAEVKTMFALVLKTKALVDAVACVVKEVGVQTLCYTHVEIDFETLIYVLADRPAVVEKEKVGSTKFKAECKVVLNTLQPEKQRLNSIHLATRRSS